jgi:formate dehydrogenase subunit gamma
MESEPRVLKHELSSRLFHWGLILGFLPAALTGLVIWLKPGGEDFVNFAMKIHLIGACILTVSALLYTIFAMDRIVAFIRHSFTWDRNDIDWFMVMIIRCGYIKKILFRKHVDIPPMGKVNSGQKAFSILLLAGGAFLIFSGWILWAFIPYAPKFIIYWLNIGHLLFALALTMFLCVHIFLGIYFQDEFKAMFTDGTQSLEVAKEHAPVWVEKEVIPVVNRIKEPAHE